MEIISTVRHCDVVGQCRAMHHGTRCRSVHVSINPTYINSDEYCLLGSPTLVVMPYFTAVLSFSFSRDTAVSGHQIIQMYSGGSVVGEAPRICPESSPTPPLILQGGGQKGAKFGVIFNIVQI